MKSLPLLLALVPTLAFSHPDHGTEPGKDHTHAVRTGNGAFTFETVPGWGALPDGKNIGPTHGGVVVDPKTGRVYVSTDSLLSVLVFEADGKYVGNIAPDCQGFHAMDIREEEGRAVLYGAQLNGYGNGLRKQAGLPATKPRICKIDTEGKLLLEIPNANTGEIQGGWGGLTGVTVAPDGSIFCSMGYGSQLIHRFDATGKHLKTFGGRGNGEKVLTNTSHGLKIDTRYGEPRLLICDRENRRLFHATLDGEWIGIYATNLRRPCSVSILGEHCAVAELEARVTVLDKNGTPVAFLGDNPDRKQWAAFPTPLDKIADGVFTAPHGLSFDPQGNLYVQDWNQSGRITKLARIQP
ncbi:MAG: hypothetical protein MUF31_04175 [Akkermansiaceae bacterium]|jgi:DNA-binding beta-propeller fold protein YncE|nr:hypothetical protein [Akkermansiaceae bacterium]